MEMLDQRVKTPLAKTAEYFQRMEGGCPVFRNGWLL
jgi:hypothetical protein